MFVDYTGASRLSLDHALSQAPRHLTYPLRAVRDAGCAFVCVAQSKARFFVPTALPTILIIGDDLHTAMGPAGFHAKSLRRYLSRCRAAAIVACDPVVPPYSAMTASAIEHRHDVVIVETRQEHEADWHAFLRNIVPTMPIILASVLPEGTA